ncbi:MAG: L,D-transpeptidase [Pseudolabrys sp.]|nr:L,D-transpeptidase [Pseudolabrys sp.]
MRWWGVAAFVAVVSLSAPVRAEVTVAIDKTQQTMSVSINGAPTYNWAVSTGTPGRDTPNGRFTAQRLAKVYYSKKFDDAPMPNSVFFYEGYAIHGTLEENKLGTPASHGCVRLTRANAITLYNLVEKQGLRNVRIVIAGDTPKAPTPMASTDAPVIKVADRDVAPRTELAPDPRGPSFDPRYDPRLSPYSNLQRDPRDTPNYSAPRDPRDDPRLSQPRVDPRQDPRNDPRLRQPPPRDPRIAPRDDRRRDARIDPRDRRYDPRDDRRRDLRDDPRDRRRADRYDPRYDRRDDPRDRRSARRDPRDEPRYDPRYDRRPPPRQESRNAPRYDDRREPPRSRIELLREYERNARRQAEIERELGSNLRDRRPLPPRDFDPSRREPPRYRDPRDRYSEAR